MLTLISKPPLSIFKITRSFYHLYQIFFELPRTAVHVYLVKEPYCSQFYVPSRVVHALSWALCTSGFSLLNLIFCSVCLSVYLVNTPCLNKVHCSLLIVFVCLSVRLFLSVCLAFCLSILKTCFKAFFSARLITSLYLYMIEHMRDRQTDGHTKTDRRQRQIDRRTNRQTDKDRQTDRWTGKDR